MNQFLIRQKFRFDLGQGFMAIINFAFVVLAASDKLATLVALPAKVVVPCAVPIAVIMVWVVGYVLDRLRFYEGYNRELNARNEMLKSIHDTTTK